MSNRYENGKQTRLYHVWSNMIQRCTNPNNKRYKDYGERGITVCDEWRHDFDAFEKWALSAGYDKNAQHKKCTIDRIDVNRGYSPDNCRFADNITQCNNKRNNRFLDCDGERHTIQEWARIQGMPDYVIRDRLWKLGWDVERAIKTPKEHYVRKGA